jgi:hypothetical protein
MAVGLADALVLFHPGQQLSPQLLVHARSMLRANRDRKLARARQ